MHINLYQQHRLHFCRYIPPDTVILVLRSFDDTLRHKNGCITQILWDDVVGWSAVGRSYYEYKL